MLYINMLKLDTLKSFAKNLKNEIMLYQKVMRDPRTPWFPKVILFLAVGYFLLPFDLIPDFIPVIGHLDDLIIIPLLIYVALKMIPSYIINDSRIKMTENND